MLPPPHIDSALINRFIEKWETLLTCYQCHRVVESISQLWEGDDKHPQCSSCRRENNTKSIFVCIHGTTKALDDPNAGDPGRVVQLLKSLLTAYQVKELEARSANLVKEKMDTCTTKQISGVEEKGTQVITKDQAMQSSSLRSSGNIHGISKTRSTSTNPLPWEQTVLLHESSDLFGNPQHAHYEVFGTTKRDSLKYRNKRTRESTQESSVALPSDPQSPPDERRIHTCEEQESHKKQKMIGWNDDLVAAKTGPTTTLPSHRMWKENIVSTSPLEPDRSKRRSKDVNSGNTADSLVLRFGPSRQQNSGTLNHKKDQELWQQFPSSGQSCVDNTNRKGQTRAKTDDFQALCLEPSDASPGSSFSSELKENSQLYSIQDNTQDSQTFSLEDSTMSLPETADFERIFPGPNFPTLPSEHQTRYETNSSPFESTPEYLKSDEIMKRGSVHCPKTQEFQQSINTMLPETADFEQIIPHREQPYCKLYGTTSTPNTCSSQELPVELPSTEDFDRICPPGTTMTTCNGETSEGKDDNTYVDLELTASKKATLVDNVVLCNNKLACRNLDDTVTRYEEKQPEQSTKDESSENLQDFCELSPLTESHVLDFNDHCMPSDENGEATTCPGLVTPANLRRKTNPYTRLEKPINTQDEQSTSLPMVTPVAPSKRLDDSYADSIPTFQQHLNSNHYSDQSKEQAKARSSLDAQTTMISLPCQSRKHPFEKSSPRTIRVCPRTLQYLFARASQCSIRGRDGEPIWGDADIYDKTTALSTSNGSEKNGWIRKARWWGTTDESPCDSKSTIQRAKSNNRLLEGYSILIASNYFCDGAKMSISSLDFSTLPKPEWNVVSGRHALEFDSINIDEMKFLCHEAGASLVESITSQQVATQKIVILVAEEVDDEMFLDRVFPSLVDKGVLPAQCKAHIPHSQIDDYKIAASATAPIVYFSWLVECIAADMAVPIFPFSLGNLYLQ